MNDESNIIEMTEEEMRSTIGVPKRKLNPIGMTKEQYLQFHRECTEKMFAITKAKNADYTGTSTDPFSNFSKVQEMGICSTEQGFMVRMHDKMARLTSFVQKGILEVKDESVEDTLLDLSNYCILMAGYLRSKKGK